MVPLRSAIVTAPPFTTPCSVIQAHRLRARFAMMAGGDVVARYVKQVGDRVVDGDEAL
jgi:hypothetical protein